jgi:hypothetical protein
MKNRRTRLDLLIFLGPDVRMALAILIRVRARNDTVRALVASQEIGGSAGRI